MQLLAHLFVRRAHARADQRKVMAFAEIEQVIEIDGLMRAVKIADAEMHDARLQAGAVIARDSGRFCSLLQIGG